MGKPSWSRYQLLQPVFQIVLFAATRRSSSKRSIAAVDAHNAPHSPDRTVSIS